MGRPEFFDEFSELSVIRSTHGKEGVVAAVDGKEITVNWSRGVPTVETSRRLVRAADYEQKQTSAKHKAASDGFCFFFAFFRFCIEASSPAGRSAA